jgi:hypothetical protein
MAYDKQLTTKPQYVLQKSGMLRSITNKLIINHEREKLMQFCIRNREFSNRLFSFYFPFNKETLIKFKDRVDTKFINFNAAIIWDPEISDLFNKKCRISDWQYIKDTIGNRVPELITPETIDDLFGIEQNWPIRSPKLEIEGIELTQEESTAIMDGMTSMLFEYFKTQDIDAYYEGNVDWNEAYSFVREKLKKALNDKGQKNKLELQEGLRVLKERLANKEISQDTFNKALKLYDFDTDKLQRLVKIREILLLPSKGDEQWLKAWKRHADRMRAYGVKYDVDDYILDETEAGRDREFGKEQGSTDERENIPPAVRLWIATRNKSKEVNSLGFPLLMDFNDSYNYLLKILDGFEIFTGVFPPEYFFMRKRKILLDHGVKNVESLSEYESERYYLLCSVIDDLLNNKTLFCSKLMDEISLFFHKEPRKYYWSENELALNEKFYSNFEKYFDDKFIDEFYS